MCSYFSLYPFLFLFLITNFIADLPVSFSEDDPSFTVCSRPFECGDLSITYPFYGNDRPEYCGLPGFELSCQDGVVHIQIQSEDYLVLGFTEANHSIRLATTQSWNDNCPSRYVNISLPSNLFSYFLPITQNMTLYYDCPIIPELLPTHKFPCSIDDISRENYFWVNSTRPPRALSRCNHTVVLPVLEAVVQSAVVQSFGNSQSTVEDVLSKGFEVAYVTNARFCDNCEGSGGQCGRDWNTSQATCFCYDGPYPERCASIVTSS